MSKITTTVHEDGTATLSGGLGDIHIDGYTCDGCGQKAPFPVTYEYVATGATGRICAVMWLCTPCGEALGAEQHTEECVHE